MELGIVTDFAARHELSPSRNADEHERSVDLTSTSEIFSVEIPVSAIR